MADDVLAAAAQFRAALERNDTKALNRLIRAYKGMFGRLKGMIDALMLEIERDNITAGQLVRMTRYKELIAQVANELAKFGAFTEVELRQIADFGIRNGIRDAGALVYLSVDYNPIIVGQFNRLPAEVIEQLLGFLADDGPLYARLRLLAPTTAELVERALIEGVGLGLGPRQLAANITSSLGMGLTDALRMTRTVQLWSYREASRATYAANSNIVEGWIWYAKLDGSTCMSCVAQHGTLHPLDEPLNDHHNGRCAPIPKIIGRPNPVDELGAEWFDNQPASVQREMLGKGKYNAWTDGQFAIDDLSAVRLDEVYGDMRVEQTLTALLGEG